MSSQLGQILLNEKAITPAKLDEAIQAQVIYGGKLGTNLVELGYIDISTLGGCLSRKFGVPSVEGNQIKPCTEKVLTILGKKLAAKYRCVPLALEGSRLDLLMENPADFQAIDEISFATGKRINPHVAPELIIMSLLEKYYGIQREMRYIRISSHVTPKSGASVSPAPPPDLPAEEWDIPETETPKAIADETFTAEKIFGRMKDLSGPALNTSRPSPRKGEILESPIIDLEELVQDAPAIDLSGPGTRASSGDDSLKEAEEESQELELVDELPEILTLQEATQRLKEVQDRDELSHVLISFALGYFKRAALFLTRQEVAVGWYGMGGKVDKNRVKNIMLPLNMPSIFKTVYDSKAFFLGAVPDTPLNGKFLGMMGGETPQSVFLIPVLFKGNVVNILYGDNGDGEKAPFDISELLILAPQVPQAFENLIRKKKSEARPSL